MFGMYLMNKLICVSHRVLVYHFLIQYIKCINDSQVYQDMIRCMSVSDTLTFCIQYTSEVYYIVFMNCIRYISDVYRIQFKSVSQSDTLFADSLSYSVSYCIWCIIVYQTVSDDTV